MGVLCVHKTEVNGNQGEEYCVSHVLGAWLRMHSMAVCLMVSQTRVSEL